MIDPSATLLYSEILMAGRKYHGDGEVFQYDLFSSMIRAQRPCQSALFTEKFIVRPHERPVQQVGVMGFFDVFANVILLTPKHHADRIFEQVPAVFNEDEGWAAGASRLPHDAGLIYKVVARETAIAKAKIRDFWAVVRPEVVGAEIPRQFAWR